MPKIKKRADGRYQAKVMTGHDDDGKAIYKFIYGKSQSEVDEKKEELKKLNKLGNYKNVTVSEWLDEWIEILNDEETLAESTRESYESICRLHIKPEIGKHKLQDLTPQHIRKMLKTKKDEGLSLRRQQYIYVTLNAAIKQAIRDEITFVNPCAAVNKPKPEDKEQLVLSDIQFKALLKEAKGSEYYVLYELAWDSGMRNGELLGLPWHNVDFKKNAVKVTQKVIRTSASGVHITTKLKSKNSYRTIPITKEVMTLLKKYKAEQSESICSYGLGYKGAFNLIFPNADGSPQEPSNVSNDFKRIIRKLGFDDSLHFHDLRHTHATNLAEMGVHPKAMQTRLGHATSAFTMDKYTHNTEKIQDGITEKLAERRNPKNGSSQKVVKARGTK